MNVVVLECASCDGPVGKGITLGFSIRALGLSSNGAFTGAPKRIAIPLLESSGWLKDPQNSLLSWTVPSRCDMIQVLSRLSSIKILGDWTTWYETIALDNVQIANIKGKKKQSSRERIIFHSHSDDLNYVQSTGQLPVCAMERPDASICVC